MFKEIEILDGAGVAELRRIAASAPFVDGRITNPHNQAKQNLQLHDPAAYQRSAEIVLRALMASEEFRDFAFPASIAPPMLTRYEPGMRYGGHADAAYIQLPNGVLRSDLSCTVFLNDPDAYEGGALRITLGTREMRFRCAPGTAIVYPSDTVHEVEPVTKGERLVAITFIQSRIKDTFQRQLLYELNEIAALEGLTMSHENFTLLQLVQQKLYRHWGEKP
ncbi:MAG: Fe2+-dependent dioxygenase [Alphaproteobacteria bacterium]|nr:Fe2+-dependent dioxygenase [Alphaproteobacteria bacterium]